MSDQSITLQLEFPQEVAQEDVWDFDKKLGEIASVTTDLREPRSFIDPTHLFIFIHIVEPYVRQAAMAANDIKAIHDIAKITYNFLHKEKANGQGKNKVVIIRNGKRIELYNLSLEQIEKLLEE